MNVRELVKHNLREVVCKKKIIPDDYPKDIYNAMVDISSPNYKMMRFGTSVYKHLIYASDIDLLQTIPVDKIMHEMQNVIRKLLSKGYIIGDIKAGIKNEHAILDNFVGSIRKGKLYGYSGEQIIRYAKTHNIKQLLNVPLNPNLKEWLEVKREIHLFLTLRFRPQDILNGYLIQDGKRYNLVNTIMNNWKPPVSLDKIDIYIIVNGRIKELTNIYNLDFDVVFNLQPIKLAIFENILLNNNYPKALKRAYTVAREMGDEEMLKKLTPFMVSKINCGITFLTDVKAVLTILEYNKMDTIKNVILMHLKCLIERMKDYECFNIIPFVNMIKRAITNINNEKEFIKILEDFTTKISKIFNFYTIQYIKKMKINLYKYMP